jgi:hypothetical protein
MEVVSEMYGIGIIGTTVVPEMYGIGTIGTTVVSVYKW